VVRQPDVRLGVAALYHLLRKHVLSSDRQTAAFVVLGPLSVVRGPWFGVDYREHRDQRHSMALAVVGTFGSIAIALMYMWFHRCAGRRARAVTVVAPAAQHEALTGRK